MVLSFPFIYPQLLSTLLPHVVIYPLSINTIATYANVAPGIYMCFYAPCPLDFRCNSKYIADHEPTSGAAPVSWRGPWGGSMVVPLNDFLVLPNPVLSKNFILCILCHTWDHW